MLLCHLTKKVSMSRKREVTVKFVDSISVAMRTTFFMANPPPPPPSFIGLLSPGLAAWICLGCLLGTLERQNYLGGL